MEIKLKNIGKKYEGNSEYTLNNINIDIDSKDFVVILGPSGCGKTTLLRMLAGLNSITKGDLLFEGRRVNELSPADRGLAMVFQSYALYPQLNVYNNIAYGLKIRKVRKDLIDKRVRDVAKILHIEEHLYNKPADLSGGQRQRVAIGRAIARKPSIFLMDEPLSNLDAKLREKMRKELLEIHEMVGSTTIYVTHDQLEAMTMATKIILLDKGVIQQVDKPINFYHKPNNLFVAGFIGSPAMNFIKGKVSKGIFKSNDTLVTLKVPHKVKDGTQVVLGVRSEDITITKTKTKETFQAKLHLNELLGKEQLAHFYTTPSNEIVVTLASEIELKNSEVYNLKIDPKKFHLFDKKTTRRIKLDGSKITPVHQK